MLDYRRVIFNVYVRKCVGTAVTAQQQRVTLGVIPATVGIGCHGNKTAVRILTVTRRNAFADNRRPGVPPDVDHLGTCVSLLAVLGYRNRIKFAYRTLARKNASRIFPCDG